MPTVLQESRDDNDDNERSRKFEDIHITIKCQSDLKKAPVVVEVKDGYEVLEESDTDDLVMRDEARSTCAVLGENRVPYKMLENGTTKYKNDSPVLKHYDKINSIPSVFSLGRTSSNVSDITFSDEAENSTTIFECERISL